MTEDLQKRIKDLERERDMLTARLEAALTAFDVVKSERDRYAAELRVMLLEHGSGRMVDDVS